MTLPGATYEWKLLCLDTSELEVLLAGTQYTIIYRMGSSYPVLTRVDSPYGMTELCSIIDWESVIAVLRAPVEDMPSYLSFDKYAYIPIIAQLRLEKGV